MENLRRDINRNFIIKYNYRSTSKLVGWRGLVELEGLPRAKWLCRAALASDRQVYQWSGRNGRKWRFYSK